MKKFLCSLVLMVGLAWPASAAPGNDLHLLHADQSVDAIAADLATRLNQGQLTLDQARADWEGCRQVVDYLREQPSSPAVEAVLRLESERIEALIDADKLEAKHGRSAAERAWQHELGMVRSLTSRREATLAKLFKTLPVSPGILYQTFDTAEGTVQLVGVTPPHKVDKSEAFWQLRLSKGDTVAWSGPSQGDLAFENDGMSGGDIEMAGPLAPDKSIEVYTVFPHEDMRIGYQALRWDGTSFTKVDDGFLFAATPESTEYTFKGPSTRSGGSVYHFIGALPDGSCMAVVLPPTGAVPGRFAVLQRTEAGFKLVRWLEPF